MARQAGGGACRACPELAEGLPLENSSNFFVNGHKKGNPEV